MSMRERLRGKDFLTLMDFAPTEIEFILDVAADLKRKWSMKEPHPYLRGRTVAMVFEKHSTRTRFSFQAAVAHLGAQSFYAVPAQMQLARGSPSRTRHGSSTATATPSSSGPTPRRPSRSTPSTWRARSSTPSPT